jgi:hypothetical protein
MLLALSDVLWRRPQPELDALFKLVFDNGGIIEAIMPPLVKVVFGLPIGAGEVAGRLSTAAMAAAILAALGRRAKVVHGSVDCLYGTFGAPLRFAYGTQIPGFDGMIRALLALEGGMAQAIPEAAR